MSQKSQETKPASLKTRTKTSCWKHLKSYFIKPWIILHVILFLFCSVLAISILLWKYRHKHIKKIFFTFRESLIIIIKYQPLLVKDLLYLHPRHKNAWNFFFFFQNAISIGSGIFFQPFVSIWLHLLYCRPFTLRRIFHCYFLFCV